MLNAKDIQKVSFSFGMRGYKVDEVDAFLDTLTEELGRYENALASMQSKVEALEKEISDKDSSMSSINTVLLSAQKLAESIIEDAKKQADATVEAANAEAENIKVRTKKALEEIDAVLTEQKNKAQEEVDQMLSDAARKSEGMILAAKDSVTREQLLFDKLKSEVAEFKHHIKDTYKEHIESLSKLPEEVVLSPELAASTVEEIINNEPDLLRFIEKTPVVTEPEAPAIVDEIFESSVAVEEEEPAEQEYDEDMAATRTIDLGDEQVTSSGFVVQPLEEEDEDDAPNFSKGFFVKKD